jgi:dTDP-4-amino-4,6-dideoxygalactose transaminase
MKIGPGDEVIFPSYVCTALLNAVRYVGAKPVLAEIDPDTLNIDPANVKKRLSARTKAVIAPHLFGLPADIDAITAMGVPVIEDCAQSVGAVIDGRRVGAFGHAAVFSFYATKVITTGEGGMVVSDDLTLLERIRDLKEYDGKKSNRVRYNYKMTDMQAAMGMAQLQRLATFIARRRTIARKYDEAFRALPVRLPKSDSGHIYYRYLIRLAGDVNEPVRKLAKHGIESAIPVHLPLHRHLNLDGYHVTEELWKRSLSIPIYPSLTENEIKRVIDVVGEVTENSR